MATARQRSIHLEFTPYYHVVSPCVRRNFLCGEDPITGKNFDHRKQWLVDRIKTLGEIFSINIFASAAMPNHYHLVLHVDLGQAKQWTDRDVIQRWGTLFTKSIATLVVDRQSLTPRQKEAVDL